MTVSLSPIFNDQQFSDQYGNPLSGGFIYTYAAGSSSILQTTYSNSAGTTPNTNPIVLNSAGRCMTDIWLTNGSLYNLVLKDVTGVVIASSDNIGGFIVGNSLVGSNGASSIGFESETVQSVLYKGRPLANYTALRAYTGSATIVNITDDGINGSFYYDPTDTTSSDNAGTIIIDGASRRWKRTINTDISVKWFGCKGDNTTDDSVGFSKALAYCESRRVSLYVPDGTYKLSTWSTRNSTYVTIRGCGFDSTRIVGPTLVGTHFVKMISGTCDIEGVSLERWEHGVYSEVAYDLLRLCKCKAYQNRGMLARAADLDVFPQSKIRRVIVTDNLITYSAGVQLHGAIDSALLTDNIGFNVYRDSTVWSGNLFQTFFLSVGDTNNVTADLVQTKTKNIVMADNSCDTIYNTTPSGTFNTTNAFQATGISVTLTGNIVKNQNAVDPTNCEAYYCKAQVIVIDGNTAIDGTKSSATIAVKGAINAQGPIGRTALISNNVLKVTTGNVADSGIVVFYSGDIDIIGNVLDGYSVDSIKIYNEPSRVNIIDNHITNNGGSRAITLQCGEVNSIRIEGNTIDNILTNATSDLRPINIQASNSQLKDITMSSGGSGYTSIPVVVIGAYCAAHAVLTGQTLTSIVIDFTNSYFSVTPTIQVVGGGGVATAHAVLSTGSVTSIVVDTSNNSFTSVPTINIINNNPEQATAQCTVVSGVVTGTNFNGGNNLWTYSPPVYYVGGGGSGAAGTANLASGAINDVYICDNVIRWSPRTGLSSAAGVFLLPTSITTRGSGKITLVNNEIIADANSTYNNIIGFNIFSSVGLYFNDLTIRGLHMFGPNIVNLKPVAFNNSADIFAQSPNYTSITVNNVSVNGVSKRVLSSAQIEDTRATFLINCNGLTIGDNIIGYIPYNVMVPQAYVFTSAVPTSATNTATIKLTLGGTIGNILGSTAVTAFTANAGYDCIPNNTAANLKRAFVDGTGRVPVLITIGNENLTGGVLTLVMNTELVR